jgi:signal transduction histidine kinase
MNAGERFPIVYQGQAHGALVIASRTPGEPLTAAERRLLTDLARQAGAASNGRELLAALQRSREQLVTDREDDRRRIRRDLHDGLGPALAGMLLRVDVAADLVTDRPDAALDELAVLKQQLRDSTEEVRRVVHGLRPPALDELGLVPALRAQALAFASPGGGNPLTIHVEAPDTLMSLPAAVEVTVLRVAGEAVTNVVRHAGARFCTVRLAVGGDVDLEVEDDGVGIPAEPRSGVGLRSMRERAAELGGSLDITRGNGRGTLVHLRLPLAEPT